MAFYIQVKKIVAKEDYDIVYSTSSRLFTAFLGARISNKKKIPLYLDIRDIFVESIGDILKPQFLFFLRPILNMIERYTFSTAKHINLVSRGFKNYFETRYLQANYSYFTNGIDDEFLNFPELDRNLKKESTKPTILYAGNIGDGQGLHNILPELSEQLEDHFSFKVIGDGRKKERLMQSINERRSIKVLPPISRSELFEEYMNADILFLHLNNYSAYEKVLPSKVFEYAATGKPILAGVNGYSAKFINEEIPNASVFNSGNHKEAIAALESLNLEYTDRSSFIQKYSRSKIMKQMSQSILLLE